MKHYEFWLTKMDYAKFMYDLHGFEKCMDDYTGYYRLFMELGYKNMYSYYSIFCHERYFKEVNGIKLFVFRNSGSYFFESNIEPMSKITLREGILNESPYCIELKIFHSESIKRIDREIFS